jgi:hypothetical protein
MMLLDMLSNISEQLRLSPISTSANIVQWLTQAIKSTCIKSRFLEKFCIVPAKANVQRYLLPGDHIATTGMLFDGSSLGRINVVDADFVSPTTPTYYYEDEWNDEASEAGVAEFATHYTLNELWPLQLMRSQPSAGAKTFTLVCAPTVDGTAAASPIVGILDGTVDSTTLVWDQTAGMVISVLSTELNTLIFYKYIDVLPVDAETDIEYSDLLGILYSAGTLGLALSTEDDEYDRYRSWLYEYVATSISGLLGTMAVNRSIP